MAYHSYYLLCIFSLLLSLSSLVSSSSSHDHNLKSILKPDLTNIVLPLLKYRKSDFKNVSQKLNHIADISLHRAAYLKNPNRTHSKKTAVYAKSYGEYLIALTLGTPPQTVNLILDTGSEVVWVPCTDKYSCFFCNSTPVADVANTYVPSFDPKLSSSSKPAGCNNPICRWMHRYDQDQSCQDTCPRYYVEYGSGFTNGSLLSETLHFQNNKLPNFTVGCSDFSLHIYSGIAGFGRGMPSLPSQLGLRKFSYCLLSRKYNDTSKSSPLVLYSGSDPEDEKFDGLSCTPFIKSPLGFSTYYYLGLNKISVGGKKVDIPEDFLSLRSDGKGGTIIDSGTTFTYMEKKIFDLVVKEIDKFVEHYPRAKNVEDNVQLDRCYELPKEKPSFPKIAFHFKEGAEMDFPTENSFWFIENNKSRVACLALVSGLDDNGPAMILGNFQQQNYYVEYDLKNERFGFRLHDCKNFHSKDLRKGKYTLL